MCLRLAVKRFLTVAVIAIASGAAAQTALPNPFLKEKTFTRNTQYLAHLQAYRAERSVYEASQEWRTPFIERLSWLEPFVGNYSQALELGDTLAPIPSSRPELATTFSKYRPVDARAAILKRAMTHQVIMVNEEHYVSEHRAFTLTLLKGLYARGFRYFAAEDLDERDVGLQQRGYPTFKTGYYSRDPVFGDLIRTALHLGYRVVPYEATTPVVPYGNSDPLRAINDREREQAEHLRDRVFKHDPEAKLLVHVGRGHHSEKTTDLEFEGKKGQIKLMGVWFKELTGIDPYTVDQMTMCERIRPAYENEFYRWATANHPRAHPTIYRDGNGQEFLPPFLRGSVDLLVVHPRTKYEHGRPSWLWMRGHRSPAPIPKGLRPHLKERRLLQALVAGEDRDAATPVDQFEIKSGNLPRLMLPKVGAFTLRVVDEGGNVIAEESLRRY